MVLNKTPMEVGLWAMKLKPQHLKSGPLSWTFSNEREGRKGGRGGEWDKVRERGGERKSDSE